MTVRALVNIISREPRAFKQAAAKVRLERLSSGLRKQNHIICPELLYLQTLSANLAEKF